MIEHDEVFYNITDARMSIDVTGTPYICHNKTDCKGAEADDMLGYSASYALKRDFTDYCVTNLKLAVPRSVRDAEVGELVTSGEQHYMVIDVLPNSVLTLPLPESNYSDPTRARVWYTRDELEKGFAFVDRTPAPPEEMTLAEVCEALGKTIIIKELYEMR